MVVPRPPKPRTWKQWDEQAMVLQQQLREAQRHPPKDLGKCQICTKSGIHTHTWPKNDDTVPMYVDGKKIGTIPVKNMHDPEEIGRRLEAHAQSMVCDAPPWECLQNHIHTQAPLPAHLPKTLSVHDFERNYYHQQQQNVVASQLAGMVAGQMALSNTNFTYTSWPHSVTECSACDKIISTTVESYWEHKKVCPGEPPTKPCEICSESVRVKKLVQYTPPGKDYMLLLCDTCQSQIINGPTKVDSLSWREKLGLGVGVPLCAFLIWVGFFT